MDGNRLSKLRDGTEPPRSDYSEPGTEEKNANKDGSGLLAGLNATLVLLVGSGLLCSAGAKDLRQVDLAPLDTGHHGLRQFCGPPDDPSAELISPVVREPGPRGTGIQPGFPHQLP